MANFRRSVELQQASDQIVSAVNETKNFASNNILPDGVAPGNEEVYAYRLTPVGNNIVRDFCSREVSNTSDTWTCDRSYSQPQMLISDYLKNIVVEGSGCEDVLLITLTNDWQYREENNMNYTDIEYCEFLLKHKEDDRVFRTFVFNAKNNSFEVEYAK